VRANVGHLVKVEVEVDTLAQLEEALGVGVDAVLLDNMSLGDLQKGVAMIDGRAVGEASGRVNLETAPAIAEAGVDLISVAARPSSISGSTTTNGSSAAVSPLTQASGDRLGFLSHRHSQRRHGRP
jgi:hypothetical protein